MELGKVDSLLCHAILPHADLTALNRKGLTGKTFSVRLICMPCINASVRVVISYEAGKLWPTLSELRRRIDRTSACNCPGSYHLHEEAVRMMCWATPHGSFADEPCSSLGWQAEWILLWARGLLLMPCAEGDFQGPRCWPLRSAPAAAACCCRLPMT